jgi:hypothetical protein
LDILMPISLNNQRPKENRAARRRTEDWQLFPTSLSDANGQPEWRAPHQLPDKSLEPPLL